MKAVAGVALIAGAVVLDVFTAGAATPFEVAAIGALASSGASLVAGAIASELTNNRGMNITTRQPAANRQVIYGCQRVGGVIVYSSTTGGKKDQYNFVIVLAGHECWGIQSLYLDGRLVYFEGSGAGWSVQNGMGFGGNANGNTYTGPNGVQYNFGTLVYCEARYGTQEPGDVIGGLTANDPNWAANAQGSPYLGGCTYVYLKVEYDTAMFPSLPEIRFTVFGKPVLDPRTGTTAYSSNSALVAADWAADITNGLGLAVNETQLIAAANVCDELVDSVGAGADEYRYACHYHFDTGSTPSDVFSTLLKSMGGRYSQIGGECYLWPAYWQGPSASFDEAACTASLQWDPTASYKELCNRVTGTYTAPNFPYNIAGDLYDSNGFYDGEIQDNFQFGFQPTNFPQYAADPQHGYAADQWLNEDSGVQASWEETATYALGEIVSYTQVVAGVSFASVWKSLIANNTGNVPGPASASWANAAVAMPREVSYNMVLSISQAQRLAKIEMLRSRFPGAGTFELGLSALAMQECDVMDFTFPLHGWVNKPLEIVDFTYKIVAQEPQPGELPAPPEHRIVFGVHETDPSIYEWETTEEQNIYDLPALPQQAGGIPPPPTDMELISGAATAIVAPDGTVTPRIEVTWGTPQYAYVTQIQMQYQLTSDSSGPWTDAGMVDVSLNAGYISPVVAGQPYNVQIRSLCANGAASAWVAIDNFTAGLLVNSQTQIGVGPGSLVGLAFSAGTAAIECLPFTALIGQLSLPIFPGGPVFIYGLEQLTFYYVYYIDPTTSGGNVAPIATTNINDFIGKQGYFLIGSITTPFSSAGAVRWYPGGYSDTGTMSTSNPTGPYALMGTAAIINAEFFITPTVEYVAAAITYSDFPNITPTGDAVYVTLSVTALGPVPNPSGAIIEWTALVQVSFDGGATWSTLTSLTETTEGATYSINVPSATYSIAVPTGTDLDNICVRFTPSGTLTSGAVTASSFISISVTDIHIQ